MKPRYGKGVRIAVIGATTSDGSRLRERLAGLGVPGAQVDLYGGSRGEAVISEYDGEARLIQDPEPSEIAGHDVIFLCEAGTAAEKAAADAPAGSIVIDIAGCLAGESRPPLVHMDINPEAARNHGGCLAVPHPVALMLAELLDPLERELGLAEVVAFVLRPAADFGETGVEELRQQTIQLLSFAEVPVETFGRQLAFNIIPQARMEHESPRVESRIADDIAQLLGWPRSLLTIRMMMAPVFYGHCLQMRLRFGAEASVTRIRELLEAGAFSVCMDIDAQATPMDVSGERTTNLYEVGEDGLGGFWLMAVAGELNDKGAEQAVRVADSVFGL